MIIWSRKWNFSFRSNGQISTDNHSSKKKTKKNGTISGRLVRSFCSTYDMCAQTCHICQNENVKALSGCMWACVQWHARFVTWNLSCFPQIALIIWCHSFQNRFLLLNYSFFFLRKVHSYLWHAHIIISNLCGPFDISLVSNSFRLYLNFLFWNSSTRNLELINLRTFLFHFKFNN